MTFKGLLKGSLLCRAIGFVASVFSNAYKNSRLKRFTLSVSNCFNESFTHTVLSHYVNKKPYFRYSLTYRLVIAIMHIVDIIFAFINNVFTKLFSGSSFCNDVISYKKSSLTQKLELIGVLVVSVSMGSFVSMALNGDFTRVILGVNSVIFVVGIVMLTAKYTLGFLEGSILFKALKEFFVTLGE